MPTIVPKTIPTHYNFNQARPGKKLSGDYAYTENITINNKPFVILLQADGVSSSPKDYEASNRSIYHILDYFQENRNTNDIANILTEAIIYAHNQLIDGDLGTFGKKTTICAMVIDEYENRVWYAHLGDSRIYGFNGSDWEQLTQDHSTSEIYKENGKPFLQNGKPVFRSLLTQCLGMTQTPEIKITSFLNTGYYGFCCVSDGFYELSGCEDLMTKFYHSINYFHFLSKIMPIIAESQGDDASMAIWRKPMLEPSGHHNENILYTKTYSKAARYPHILPYLQDIISRPVKDKERERYLDMCLGRIFTHRIYYDKEELIALLDLLYQYNRTINPVLIPNLKKEIARL